MSEGENERESARECARANERESERDLAAPERLGLLIARLEAGEIIDASFSGQRVAKVLRRICGPVRQLETIVKYCFFEYVSASKETYLMAKETY